MKVLTVLGARPQFIKATPVSLALQAHGHEEILVHTGQHYDYQMSKVFFDELPLAEPAVNLGIGGGQHGGQTGRMLIALEEVVLDRKPDIVLVYGDTNSTLAGALVASKLRIVLAHVESGLRSFNRDMPEEINRVLTDHCSDIFFCPTATAVENLAREGITRKVELVGDTMCDAIRLFPPSAERSERLFAAHGVAAKNYVLATIHRPANTDDPRALSEIMGALAALEQRVIFPLHPRTRGKLSDHGIVESTTSELGSIRFIDPVGYLDMLALERSASVIVTDSGGIQKEAHIFAVPCVTARDETEWLETLGDGWNVLVGHDAERIKAAVQQGLAKSEQAPPACFGDGHAAGRIAVLLGRG
ncbi:MAG TPA: UDP-N-acetylglucosamine 2-epimerase (non-hydrolyzing) [Polyangiaceae bacterium]|nr:UDP-N-acetylglucosamine 2-epimerase (non-hydrolyzing) [Polyangiaceae bacterium]